MWKLKTLIIGFAAGIVSGLIGIGGAIVMVPGMTYILGLTQHMASATSLAVVIPGALVSTAIYHSFGQLDLSLTFLFALGGVVGSLVGSSLMPHIRPIVLKRIWAVVAMLMAIKMGME
jgi:uncharacterized membrane protein YfcA